MPTRSAADYEAVLSRLRATPALVDQTIAWMRQGVRRGITPPKVTLGGVVAQVEAMLVDDPAKSPLLGTFQRMPEAIPADRRESLKADAAKALAVEALPAFRRLRDFLANDYVPNCRESLATSALPDGRDWYAYRVAHSTTTRLTPEQIHQIGLEEVQQIRAEMERLMRATSFAGELPAFFDFLRTDPRFFHSRPDELLAGYREIAKRADPEVIKLFGRNRTKAWARALMWPGIQLQRLTTREPDTSQLAVAIAALEAVLAMENLRDASDEDKIGIEVAA